MKNSYGFDRLSRDMLMLAVALGIIAVSYTHLDVYKRQTLLRSIENRREM